VPDPDLADELLPDDIEPDLTEDEELLEGVLTDLPDPELFSVETLDLLAGVDVDVDIGFDAVSGWVTDLFEFVLLLMSDRTELLVVILPWLLSDWTGLREVTLL
jgi:hypothetical protein